jgi:hypothetical protein
MLFPTAQNLFLCLQPAPRRIRPRIRPYRVTANMVGYHNFPTLHNFDVLNVALTKVERESVVYYFVMGSTSRTRRMSLSKVELSWLLAL